MPIDPSIALQAGKGVTPLDNPINSLASVAQIQNAQAQNALAQASLRKQDQDYADQQNLRAIYSAADTSDPNGVINALAKGGRGDLIPGYQKTVLDNQKIRSDIDKDTTASAPIKADVLGRLGKMMQEGQDGWDHAILLGKGINVDVAGKFGTTFNKDIADHAVGAAMSLKDQQEAADRGRGLVQKDIELTNKRDENQGNLYYRGVEANKPQIISTPNGDFKVGPTGSTAPLTVGTSTGGVGYRPAGAPIDTSGQPAQQQAPKMAPQGQPAPRPAPTSQAPQTPSAPGTVSLQPGAQIGQTNYYTPKAIEAAQTHKEELDQQVNTGQELMQRIAAQRDAMEKFQTGMGTGNRIEAARIAKSIGAPDSLVSRIAGGDIAAAQEFTKLANTGAIANLRQALDGQGKTNKAEFEVFAKNSPNIELDPKAIDKILSFQQGQYQRTFNEQQAFQSFLDKGGNPAAFSTVYAAKMHQSLPGIAQQPQPTQPSVPSVQMPTPPSAKRGGIPALTPDVQQAIQAELARRGVK